MCATCWRASWTYQLYQTTKTSALRELLMRWDRPLVSIRCVTHDTQHTFTQLFSPWSKANWTLFATWDHFGIAAMKSETRDGFCRSRPMSFDSGVRVVADRIAKQEIRPFGSAGGGRLATVSF